MTAATKGADRLAVAFQAAAQIDSFVGMMSREVRDGDRDLLDIALQGIFPRMRDLTSVLMSVLGGDDLRPTAELRDVVHGRDGAEVEAAGGEAVPAPEDAGAVESGPVSRAGTMSAASAYLVVHDHLEQMYALALQVETLLGQECHWGRDDAPADCPMTAWRLAEVIEASLGSRDTLNSVQSFLRLTDEEINYARG